MTDQLQSRPALLSRRDLARVAGGIAGAAALIGAGSPSALATPKISQRAVAYENHPQGDRECDKCVQFQPPASCKVVDGVISPHGSCRIFAPARQAAG